jgi:hypothetical protein
MRALRVLLVLMALLFAAPQALVAAPVDLLLVLAADASLSVDRQSYGLQREGYAIAFTRPRVLNAIRSGPIGRIAVLYLEWAGTNEQNVIIDWFLIDSSKTARQFSNKLMELPRLSVGRTSIGNAIDFAVAQFSRAPYRAQHRIIDMSGNGINNAGRDPMLARDGALTRGITINALVILKGPVLTQNTGRTNPPGGLAKYYRDNVVGGPRSFVLEANDFRSFGEAILKKLIAEVADAEPLRK